MTRTENRSDRAPRRGVRPVALVALAVLTAGATAACSDGRLADRATDEAGGAAADAPTTSVAAADAATTDAATTDAAAGDPYAAPTTTAAPAPAAPGAVPTPAGDPVREAPTTSLVPAAAGLPAVAALNSKHQPVLLDETALLACANDQIASVELRRSRPVAAARELVAASLRAKASAVPEISVAAPALAVAATAADPSPTVDAFLATCTSRGFEF